MTAKRTAAAAVFLAVGGLIPAALPAGAAPVGALTGASAPVCTYRITGVRSGTTLPLRSGAGETFRTVGTLPTADGRLTGACTSVNGWVRVTSAAGATGWVPAKDLRRVATPSSATGRSRPACVYRVAHVRRSSFLSVRSGPGLRFHRVGSLRAGNGRRAGACAPAGGWIKIKSANGRHGWVSAHYLHKVTGPHR
ncbi:SH3 domain-containing protein [Streptosporangium sp. NPDC051022]|uniref:SH3 domain-containing protein n=1 Tax=Streptosporangium sp. NPDC051022 TaxID=3155752 RepID=UPI0034244395